MSQYDVTVLDYGLGNLGSIMNMFRRIGIKTNLASNSEELSHAKRILLPGVGAFDTGMRALHQRGLIDCLNEKALNEKIPVLGICLGMQLLTNSSEEGKEQGLGWINASTMDMRLLTRNHETLKFPHIGWNYIEVDYARNSLCKTLPDDPRFYFVHTYMVECASTENCIATTSYGDLTVTAMIAEDNIFGAQFHPEKSHKFGMSLLGNFARL